MARIIIVTMIFGGFALAGAVFLFRRVRRCLRWRKNTFMPLGKQMFLMLPGVVLSLVLFGGPLLTVPEKCPVKRSGLKEVTAPVDMVRQYETHQLSGRSVQIVRNYYIYLEGRDGSLYVPNNFRFDQDAFLCWAGSEQATFLYAGTGGRLTVYQIQRGDEVFLSYSKARECLTVTFLSDLLIGLAALLFGLGGSVYLPEFLNHRDKQVWEQRILGLVFVALLLVVIVLCTYLAGRPKITETHAAGTTCQMIPERGSHFFD